MGMDWPGRTILGSLPSMGNDIDSRRINRRALLALLMVPGCAVAPDDPRGVAEQFLQHYLVRVDQERALQSASGFAKEKLEGEIRDVATVRAAGASVERTDSPNYELSEERAGERGDTIFLFDISMPGDETASRRILVSVSPDDDSWSVTNYGFYPIR